MTKLDLSKMTKQQKLELLDVLEEKKRRKRKQGAAYVPNPGQLKVHKDSSRERYVFSGNGCWGRGTRFRLHDGRTIPVEAIEVGDQLLGPDGEPRTVLRICRGNEPLYRITPKFGKPRIVNESHVLSIYRWSSGKKIYHEPTVKEFVQDFSQRMQDISYEWTPEKGIEYLHKEVPIDPYVLGLWLGDGHSNTSAITTMDPEIKMAWYTEASRRELEVRVLLIENNRANTYSLTGRHRIPNSFLKALEILEVRRNKHIPEMYKINSQAQRLELLAGLLDTDGHLSNGRYFEITQKNQALANDIAELARSLGFAVSSHIKNVNGTDYHRVNIIGDVDRIPTRLPHKQAKPVERQRNHNHIPFKIEPIGEGEFFGFTVDKDNLVVHEDYIVQRNSGKTTLLVNEAIWAAHGVNPISGLKTKVPANIVLVLDSPEKVSAKVIPEMNKWMDTSELTFEKLGKPYISRITFKNGSQINFMFFDQDQFKFEGIDGLDFIGSDEPMPRDRYVALVRGTREKHSDPRILIVGTPISQAWLRKEVYVPWSRGERPDTMCFRFDTEVNVDNLREGFIEEFASRLSEAEKLIRLKGHFADLDGLALADLWEPDQHLIDMPSWPNGWPCVVAIDPHPRKKHIALLMGVTRDNEYRVLKEFSSRAVPSQFALELRNWYDGYRIVDIVCDSLGSSPMSGGEGNKSFIQVLNENGVRARATTFDDKNDGAWIQKIQEALAIPPEADNFGRREPRLKVVRDCLGLISDIENVQWQKNRHDDYLKPKLDISDQDYLACLKYALATQPSFQKNKERRLKSRAPSPWSGAGGSNLDKEKPRSSYFGAARAGRSFKKRKKWG